MTSVFLKRGAASDLLQNGAWPPACPLGKAPTVGSGCFFCGIGKGKGKRNNSQLFFVELCCGACCGSNDLLTFFFLSAPTVAFFIIRSRHVFSKGEKACFGGFPSVKEF